MSRDPWSAFREDWDDPSMDVYGVAPDPLTVVLPETGEPDSDSPSSLVPLVLAGALLLGALLGGAIVWLAMR